MVWPSLKNESFHLDEVQFIFSFVVLLVFKQPLPNSRSESFTLVFSSKSLIVLCFAFKVIIHFELIILWGVRFRSRFFFFFAYGWPNILFFVCLFYMLLYLFIFFLIWYYTCFNAILLDHPPPPPQSPKDCSIHLCLFCYLAYRVVITIFLNSIYMR